MRIIFFEDQYDNIEPCVTWVNNKLYKNQLMIDVIIKTDESTDFSIVSKQADAFFVDIELANKSKHDGVGIVKSLLAVNPKLAPFITIISGHSNAAQLLDREGISGIKVLEKPIEKENLVTRINEIMRKRMAINKVTIPSRPKA